MQNAFDHTWNLNTLMGSEPVLADRFQQTDPLDLVVQRVKVLNLGEQTLCLFVSLNMADHADRVAIRVQLCPAERNAVLPTGLSLTLLADSGSVVQSVVARDQDNVIQLKRFRCPIGTQFSLQVLLAPISLTENFSI